MKEADVFVMLFFTKVGMYTSEEFGKALEQFKKVNKPLMYTYFKTLLFHVNLKMFGSTCRMRMPERSNQLI